ncbi:zinc metallochaperone AztD [Streptomyces cyaneofuscatus]|uniref:Zinc metallochaperone AztD n=1 Tax=Streptomyces cyaneofuscatus TaxID=66883 RepID=A0ABZ1EQP0_9ACTN|nr:zinc metallochaperone AztD [Streptomyces cyaneofuscatus]WSB06428.1 zinc metallochaperone AztD [Streptomyces cyaneofuscatus]WSD50037.1 zinc metallochaperone AztD [Streptomyces cyaneofuscatus]WTA93456.1 zinc metallochaperone AztD [Streptomyces cyaneofuscatus]
MNNPTRARVFTGTALVVAASMALTACGGNGNDDAPVGGEPKEQKSSEAAAVGNPIVASYDGGLYVLDGETLKLAKTIALPGFNRVNPAGDKDHVVVSTDSGFRVFDATRQEFTDAEFKGAKPGHVVRHGGKTVLFTDGTGEVNVFDPAALSDGRKPEGRTYTSAKPHHGVAIELAGGELVTTLGSEEKRTGALVLDKDNKEIARAENCPGVHGEAAAQGEVVGFGCEDGVLLYKDGEFTKVDAPGDYARTGNQAGSDVSPILLGDYKTDPDAELERPTRISLIDTRTAKMKLVDLGTSYSFRSLARGPHGEALVLGTNGILHVIDPETGKVEKKIEAVGDWTEPLDWQQPRPTLFVRDHTAYVSDPGKRQLHSIDLESGKKLTSVTLPKGTNELSGTVAGH